MVTFIEPILVCYIFKIPNPHTYLFRLGNIPLKKINEIGLIIMTLAIPLYNRFNFKNYIPINFHKSLSFLKLYIISLLLFASLQVIIFNNIIAPYVKMIDYLVFPFLIISIFYFFLNRNDITLLYNYSYYIMFILFILFVLEMGIPYYLSSIGLDYSNRLGGYLYFSSNGTAAFLGIFLLSTLVKMRSNSNIISQLGFIIILILVGLNLMFTYTKAIFFAMILIFIIDIFIKKNITVSNFLILVLSSLFLLTYGTQLLEIATRGSGSEIFSIHPDSSDTLSFRIYRLWMPTIKYIFSNKIQIFVGTEFRGFNEFLEYVTGLTYANHNILIQHFSLWGGIITLILILFWVYLIKGYYSVITSITNIAYKDVVKYCFYAIFLFFISINTMSTYHITFKIQIAIIIVYSIRVADLQLLNVSNKCLIQKS